MILTVTADEAGTMENIESKKLDALNRSLETAHYVFRFAEGTEAEKEIEAIAEEQERAYSDLVDLFGFSLPTKVEYFATASPEENGEVLGELFGAEQGPINGFCIGPRYVFAVYNDTVRCVGHHEIAHLFSYRLCMPKSAFLSEGLAMYADGAFWGKPNTEWVRTFLERDTCISVLRLAEDETFYAFPSETTYPIAGAFTEFLVHVLGTETYLNKVYPSELPLFDTLADLFRCTKEQIETRFKAYCTTEKQTL